MKNTDCSQTVIMVDVDMQEGNVDDMMGGTMVQCQLERSSYTTVLPKLINESVI